MAKAKRGKLAHLKQMLGIKPKKAAPSTPATPATKPAVKKAPVKAPAKKASVKSPAKPTGKGDHWFEKMTPAQQKAYIKAHPRSKYAKMAGKGAAAKPAINQKKKAVLDGIRDELAALQKKKGTMDPAAYKAKLQTIRAKLAHATGVAKPKVGAKKTAKKATAPRKSVHHVNAEAKTKAAAAARKAHHEALKDTAAKLKEAKAAKRPNAKKIAALEKAHKTHMANKKKATAHHAAAKARLAAHATKHKEKLAQHKAAPVKPSTKKVTKPATKKTAPKVKRRVA